MFHEKFVHFLKNNCVHFIILLFVLIFLIYDIQNSTKFFLENSNLFPYEYNRCFNDLETYTKSGFIILVTLICNFLFLIILKKYIKQYKIEYTLIIYTVSILSYNYIYTIYCY